MAVKLKATVSRTERPQKLHSKRRLLLTTLQSRRGIFPNRHELENFVKIPATCHRLKKELNEARGKIDECYRIRDICVEHVQLQIRLVEAGISFENVFGSDNVNFKTNLYRQRQDNSPSKVSNQYRKLLRLMERGDAEATTMILETIGDMFLGILDEVWDLGQELTACTVNHIDSVFDLRLNNQERFPILIEAMTFYERVSQQYKMIYGNQHELYFTDIKSVAIDLVCRVFRSKTQDLFEAASREAEKKYKHKSVLKITLVLQSACNIVTEITCMKNRGASYFPHDWNVNIILTTLFLRMCFRKIIDRERDTKKLNMTLLTLEEIMDLLKWAEYFQSYVNEANLDSVSSSTNFYSDFQTCFICEAISINCEGNGIEMTTPENVLSKIRRLTNEEILARTATKVEKWLSNIYRAKHNCHRKSDGCTTSTLREDVFFLIVAYIRNLREYLPEQSDTLIMACGVIFSHLHIKQIKYRYRFLLNFKACCSAANCFLHMSEMFQETSTSIISHSQRNEKRVRDYNKCLSQVIYVFKSDAIYAARITYVHIYEPIHASMAKEFFGVNWEVQFVNNELAVGVIRTLEDYTVDLKEYLQPALLFKAVEAMISHTTVFYVRCLLVKADNHCRMRGGYFKDTERALDRMEGDIVVFKEFFYGLATDLPGMSNYLEQELEFLDWILEIMRIAAGLSSSRISDFVILVHKKLADVRMTKQLFEDLWRLVNPYKEFVLWNIFDGIEDDLHDFDFIRGCATSDKWFDVCFNRSRVPGLRINEMLAQLYLQSKRKLSIKKPLREMMRVMKCCHAAFRTKRRG